MHRKKIAVQMFSHLRLRRKKGLPLACRLEHDLDQPGTDEDEHEDEE